MKAGNRNMIFFLGGHDLEMLTIKELLDQEGVPYYDKGLKWGAKTSDYKDDIIRLAEKEKTLVFVELDDDMNLSSKNRIFVDHHGKEAGVDTSSSFRQIFDLLDIPPERWSRWFELVDANDKGHIQALENVGASKHEITKIRKADRRAQGITDEQERQGQIAVDQAETLLKGKLTIVRLPHSKTAVVTDLLHPALGGGGYENLLIISPNELNFYGKGDIVIELKDNFPDGWYGGSLPEYGFWGHSNCSANDVMDFIKLKISEKI